LADLIQFPVWEYALVEEAIEGQDERTLRPFQADLYDDSQSAYLIVRASFVLANGKQLKGYIIPIKLEENTVMEPLLPYDLNPIIICH
jgi:hypothetical protein